MAVNTVTCSVLFKGLTAHTHYCGIKCVFDLVLETKVEDTLLSCAVRGTGTDSEDTRPCIITVIYTTVPRGLANGGLQHV